MASPPHPTDCEARPNCPGSNCSDRRAAITTGRAGSPQARRASCLQRLPCDPIQSPLLRSPSQPLLIHPAAWPAGSSPPLFPPAGRAPRQTPPDRHLAARLSRCWASNNSSWQCPTGLGKLPGQNLAPQGPRKDTSIPTTGPLRAETQAKQALFTQVCWLGVNQQEAFLLWGEPDSLSFKETLCDIYHFKSPEVGGNDFQ